MDTIKALLDNKHLTVTTGKRPVNTNYEEAKEFADYVGLSVIFTLMLFKKFGKPQTLAIRSFLKDFPIDKRGLQGIAVWKLKQK